MLKKFRRTPWRFQQTYETPLRALQSFTATILASLGPSPSGTLVIDAVVMKPAKLESLLDATRLPTALRHDSAVMADSDSELSPLLCAALGDWVDFLFVPSPKPFVLYADHDEYSTFFAATKGHLHQVTENLQTQGFKMVEYFTRNP